jgi:hypothetical protein
VLKGICFVCVCIMSLLLLNLLVQFFKWNNVAWYLASIDADSCMNSKAICNGCSQWSALKHCYLTLSWHKLFASRQNMLREVALSSLNYTKSAEKPAVGHIVFCCTKASQRGITLLYSANACRIKNTD